MSGSDPTGFSWLEKVFGDSSGWEGAAAFGGFGAIVAGGAYAAYLGQGGSVSAGGLAGASGLGGAYAIGEAFAGLNDPGANATYARPTGELGQGGLYNEGAGPAPPRAEGAVACPHCIGPGSFANEAQYQGWLDGVWISSNVIFGAGSLGRWLLGRVLVSETAGAITNLGARTVASNASIFTRVPGGEGLSGVFDHVTGRFIPRHSTTATPLPAGSVAQYGGHAAVRAGLAAALGENLATAAPGRLSGFALSKLSDGSVRFGWNSGQVNLGSHGARAVPEALRPTIEAAVRAAIGL